MNAGKIIFLCVALLLGVAITPGRAKRSFKPFVLAFLIRHNYYRAKHGVPPLRMTETLNQAALKWSRHLVSIGKLAHPDNATYGQNVWGGTASDTTQNAALANRVVDKWYAEESKYDYNDPKYSSATGHFTQVVWKRSKQLGCGCASKDQMIYCTCDYAPPGNYPGQFKENVPRPVQ